MTILSIIGTRPEAIKMAPVIRELRRQTRRVRALTCVTGQHPELVLSILELFDIRPDFHLAVMRPNQSLAQLTALLFAQLDVVLSQTRPDWVLAQGDTTTVLVAGLAANYHRVRFGHVEAGLRTGDKARPFPEELNRRVADAAADALFAPTLGARENLLREGHSRERIHVTGNTVVDAVLQVARAPYDWDRSRWSALIRTGRLVLVTAHRRESFGEPLHEMCRAVRELARIYRSAGVRFLFPLHPNPQAAAPARKILSGLENVVLTDPLDYRTMIHLMKRASLVLTDSGGLQEEAPSLGTPVVLMRDTTERPEGVEAGLTRLAGTSRRRIVAEARAILDAASPRHKPLGRANPYGDGRAAQRIVAVLLRGARTRATARRARPRRVTASLA